jgi:hypothetical protein
MTVKRLGIAYFGNRYPHHAREDLREIAAAGAAIVDHTMSEADLRWNPGTIKQLVEIGAEEGLESWLCPWGLGAAFGGEASSYAVMEHPEACQQDNFGNSLPALCLNQQPFRDLMLAWLDAAAATGARVVTWDEPHLLLPAPAAPDGRWACRCPVCQELFRASTGSAMPADWTDYVAHFQHETIMRSLFWLIDSAREWGLDSGVILLPDEGAGDRGWREITTHPGVTVFGVSPYWVYQKVPLPEIETYLRRWCDRIVAATKDLPVESLAWIQAFSVPGGREAEISRGIDIMRECGIETIAVWAFRACEAMSALAPDHPPLVWETVLEGFRRVLAENDAG